MKTIAFDFDDVICPTVLNFLNFNRKEYKINVPFKKLDQKFRENIQISRQEEHRRWNLFFKNNSYSYPKPKRKIVKFFGKLKKEYKLIIVTARKDIWQYQVTNWIDLYMKDFFEEIIFSDSLQNKGKTKGDICKDKNCLFLVDDSVDNIESCFQSGIKGILYNQPWNEHYKKKVKRISSILELKKLLKILKKTI